MYGHQFNKSFLNTPTSGGFGTNGNTFGKNQFFGNKPTTFGQTPSTFGQTSSSSSLFSPMQQPANPFQNSTTPSFNTTNQQTGMTSNLFSNQPSTSGGLFGSSPAFGQNKTGFGGFGTSTTQTLFGQQPQQQTSLFQPNTSNFFGSGSGFGIQTQCGTVIKFNPVTGTDTMQKNGVAQSISTKHHCITCMKEYESKSLEELRYEDYCSNRKGPQQQTGFGASAFGTVQSTAAPTLFGQSPDKSIFGQNSGGFGQQTTTFGQNTTGFGMSNQQNTTNLFGKPSGFGTATNNTTTFGFTSTPSNNPFSSNQPPKFFSQPPLFGQNTQQQSGFGGTSFFGQNANQTTTSNLFQKPNQPTINGFNANQTGYQFNQPATTQSTNLFQTSKPNTNFGFGFGQTNTGTSGFGQTVQQPIFATSTFGKPSVTGFGQPIQSGFGTLGLQPQQSQQPTTLQPVQQHHQQQQQSTLFNKPSGLFNNTMAVHNLFPNNVFQSNPNTFNLQANQTQLYQFPSDALCDLRNVSSIISTEIYPHGPHDKLEPILTSDITTNKYELKSLLDNSSKIEPSLPTYGKLKIKVLSPKKRGDNFNQEFFETNQFIKSSYKRLVIKKVDSDKNLLKKNYNELIEEAEKIALLEEINKELTKSSVTQNDNNNNNNNNTPTVLFTNDKKNDKVDADNDVNKIADIVVEKNEKFGILSNIPDITSIINIENKSNNVNNEINPSGVILTKPEYYMIPSKEILGDYINENGECIVKGLTIGRTGYGNVHYTDKINITNMNIDEIVYFRYKEIIVYPEGVDKPPIGQGLNRPAQVTLDKIYPRVKNTNEYITNVSEILECGFTDKLLLVTQKHNCKFVEYRPETGSWVFKVNHFSKYSFTDSDEELCEVVLYNKNKENEQITIDNKDYFNDNDKQNLLDELDDNEKKMLELQILATTLNYRNNDKLYSFVGNGGGIRETDPVLSCFINDILSPFSINEKIKQSTINQKQQYQSSITSSTITSTDSIQSPILYLDKKFFNNNISIITETTTPLNNSFNKTNFKCVKVIIEPKLHPFSNLPSTYLLKSSDINERCYTDLGLFKIRNYKPGWYRGFSVYNYKRYQSNMGLINYLDTGTINWKNDKNYEKMMPNLNTIFNNALNVIDIHFDKQKIPTLSIKNPLIYLREQKELFNNNANIGKLKGNNKYLSSIWNLCSALWDVDENITLVERRMLLSEWLTDTLENDELDKIRYNINNLPINDEIPYMIFELLTYNQVVTAAELANNKNLYNLALILSQIGGNEIIKNGIGIFIDTEPWKILTSEIFQKIYLLIAGIPFYNNINVCKSIDWKRAFGLYLWYLTPSFCPIFYVLNEYQTAFKDLKFAAPPLPPYYELGDEQPVDFDIIYQILLLYTFNNSYPLRKLLNPQSHTKNFLDYRISWFLLQLFKSLHIGKIDEAEENYICISFANQLEQIGHWKWAIFVLLFIKNNTVKKQLVIKVLENHLYLQPIDYNLLEKFELIENELINKMKVPDTWIYEIKGQMALINQEYFFAFQHYMQCNKIYISNKIFNEHVLPILYINDNKGILEELFKFFEPYDKKIFKWDNLAAFMKNLFQLEYIIDSYDEYKNNSDKKKYIKKHGNIYSKNSILNKLQNICQHIKKFPRDNVYQKVTISDISRSCALFYKDIIEKLELKKDEIEMSSILDYLIMPGDCTVYEDFFFVYELLLLSYGYPKGLAIAKSFH